MSTAQNNLLPDKCVLFQEEGFSNPLDNHRPNRMCICLSDVHFTDGSVGDQSAETALWMDVFARIKNLCVIYQIEELILVLAGDSVDLIRSGKWSEAEIYPWQRDKPAYKKVLRAIMADIIHKHAEAPKHDQPPGFFYLLKGLPQALKEHRYNNLVCRPIKLQTILLLGNHDKDLLADPATLGRFYTKCLHRPVATLTDNYRKWLGQMYFDKEDYYLGNASPIPRLPFYWGDLGFRLFVTHGQWRDPANSRAQSGWQLRLWQSQGFAAFTDPCFGDTVAAGVLSGFICRSNTRLLALLNQQPELAVEINRLRRILEELDLYRPSYAAVSRIILETRRLRKLQSAVYPLRVIIEEELLTALRNWLDCEFVYQCAGHNLCKILKFARVVINLLKKLGVLIELGLLDCLMKSMTYFVRGILPCSEIPSKKSLLSMPGFLNEYRRYGFRLYCEGHTHIPLERELYFEKPEFPSDRKSYTYLNFGTWRNQIITAFNGKFRRRDVGRMLCVLDLQTKQLDGSRQYKYFTEDIMVWNDQLDKL